MFTFLNDGKPPIFYIGEKPVYTTFKKNEKYRIKPFRNSGKYLDSDEFRERYDLTRNEAKEMKRALQSDIVPENKLKTKFYRIRRSLNNRLYTEIDLRGTDKTIEWRYPEKVTEWPGHAITIASSGTGKTFKICAEIEKALKRKKKRKFVFVSPQLNRDLTLKRLLNSKRFAKHFQGVDVGDEALKESEKDLESFWKDDIEKILLDQPEGTMIIIDDIKEAVVAPYLLRFLNKALRTFRHKKLGVHSVQHKIRGARFTSTSFSNVKFVTLFPRGGGRGSQVDFLNEVAGVTRRKARELIEIFSENRYMTLHSWAPNLIFGPKYASFL